MSLLVFVDDDQTERTTMQELATHAGYRYEPIPWPPTVGDPFAKFKTTPPDLFVLDLYLPPHDGSASERISSEECAAQSVMAACTARRFSELYEAPCAGREKQLLRDTMECLVEGRRLLDSQWSAMGQHPQNGIELLRDLKNQFPGVAVIFYSRKITPENVIEVLQAGAVDAIRKGSLPDDKLLARLKRAQEEKTLITSSSFKI